MTLLETWVATPIVGAVGWALLHSLWEGAIIAAVLATALLALSLSRARYAAAVGALAAMLAAFCLTLIYQSPGSDYTPWIQSLPPLHAGSVSPGMKVLEPLNAGFAALVPWIAPLWIAGVWTCCLINIVASISVGRLRRRGVCQAPERWWKEVMRLSERLRISRPVVLLESSLAHGPIVFGHFRPLILMPVGLLAGLPAAQVEAILVHELAHVRRHDYLVNLLQRFAEGLLFYHPACWWISRVIRAERENCCDDIAVAMSGNAHEYAAALAAIEQSSWSGREPVMAATGGSLVKRIRRLLNPHRTNRAWTPLLGSVALALMAAAVLSAWQTSSPYIRWLNEDVALIINGDERTTFLKLTTDSARETFIEQFWIRRDPTPGTNENEMKEEHYRRIAHSNKRYGTSATAGWQTDRGRIYIVHGPPDEIESHPSGGNRIANPFEIWTYKYLEGIGDNVSFTFVDLTRQGEFKLVPGAARVR
jgi:GWxTD domain-containing protein